jgi:hypothetical protein
VTRPNDDGAGRWARLQRLSLERQVPPRRPRWPWVLALVALLVGYGARELHGAGRVSILVRPAIMLRRGDVHLEVRVPRDADNRLLAIAWNSDAGTAGGTQRRLAGDAAQVLHVLDLPSQPAAHYVFVATVFDRSGMVRDRATAEIHIPDQEIR